MKEKLALTEQHPLTLQQVNHWFINARQRRNTPSQVGEEEEEEEGISDEDEEDIHVDEDDGVERVNISEASEASEASSHQIDRWMAPFDHHAFAQIDLPVDPRWIEWMYDRTSTSSQLMFLIEHVDENLLDLDRILSACVSVVANNHASHVALVQQHAIERGHFRTAIYLEEVMNVFFHPFR